MSLWRLWGSAPLILVLFSCSSVSIKRLTVVSEDLRCPVESVTVDRCFVEFPFIRYLGKGCGKSARYLYVKSKGHQRVNEVSDEEFCKDLKETDFDPSSF